MARIETGVLAVAPEPSDLHTLVAEAVNRFRAGDDRNPLEVEPAEDLPMVMADRRRIVQVLSNLLSNAAGYSPEGSPIVVSAVRDGVHVAVSVTDQGPGHTGGAIARIVPQVLPRLRPGHGLRHMHRAWTGRGWASPSAGASRRPTGAASGPRATARAWGQGSPSRCLWRRPRRPPPIRLRHLPAPVVVTAARGRVRVLAVDDDPQALRYIRDVLTRAGYAPVATGDPADVPRLMAEHQPHLALLDLVLPGEPTASS